MNRALVMPLKNGNNFMNMAYFFLKREWNSSTQCLCFPSDRQPSGRRLQTDRVLSDEEYIGVGHIFFFDSNSVLTYTFGGKKEEHLSGENILSGSLMRGITFKSFHKLSPSTEQCSVSKWLPGKLEKIQKL